MILGMAFALAHVWGGGDGPPWPPWAAPLMLFCFLAEPIVGLLIHLEVPMGTTGLFLRRVPTSTLTKHV